MKIRIKHETHYTFTEQVPRLIQSVKLYPSKCKNQEIDSWSIKTNKGSIQESHQDALGHKIYNIFNNNLLGSQKITSTGIVETKNLSGLVKGLPEKVNPDCFLRQTSLTKPCRKIIKLSKNVKRQKNDLVEFCHKINEICYKSIKYVAGSTSSKTSAQKSIEQGEGVCQDFAHILISLAREHSFPARYINGFLIEDLNSIEHTTHAWAEIYISDLGWVAFDPSHNKCIDDKYVRISCGLDFLDASTIKGVKTNYSGSENLKVKVSISNCQ